MEKKGLSQEGLKLIACVTMLADHVGAVLFHSTALRLIGRISFPIYCFLLTEGVCHTRNKRRYGERLLIGALLAEIPFDLLFFGSWYWGKQSVMLTLLLGYLYCVATQALPTLGHRILLLLPFAWLGELMKVDYGGWGIIMIGMFFLSKDLPQNRLQHTLWLLVITSLVSKATVMIGPLQVPMQLFAMGAMAPILAYDGRKRTTNAWVQRGFYLFYPAHLLVLYLVK